jgi:hypothetical protein
VSDKPTMLVIVCRDDILRRGSASVLFDINLLVVRRIEFQAFVRDVAAALRRADRPDLAEHALKAIE